MNITITPHNPIKDFFYKIASKIEDCIFTLFERLPDRLIPAFLLNWMERYTAVSYTHLDVYKRQPQPASHLPCPVPQT